MAKDYINKTYNLRKDKCHPVVKTSEGEHNFHKNNNGVKCINKIFIQYDIKIFITVEMIIIKI